jgi:hypothetical protein
VLSNEKNAGSGDPAYRISEEIADSAGMAPSPGGFFNSLKEGPTFLMMRTKLSAKILRAATNPTQSHLVAPLLHAISRRAPPMAWRQAVATPDVERGRKKVE